MGFAVMLSMAHIFALAAQCAPSVAPETLYAVITTESQGNPYAIGVNTGRRLERQPKSYGEAVAAAKMLLTQGANIDLGLGQINSSNLAWLQLSVEDVFEPCANIRAAAKVLSSNYKAALAAGHDAPLGAALSAYNTGSMTKGYRNGYVAKVFRNAPTTTPTVKWSPVKVGKILVDAFGGRITDAERPWNANYGAANSYHKYGQAVDFVPEGGMRALTKRDLSALMEEAGIEVLELLGPGDPDHDDHFHIAFALGAKSPVDGLENEADDNRIASEEVEPEPPLWDVFAHAAWRKAQSEEEDSDG
jgi:Transglycosylase SLT domain